jgi:hypothetical protein
VKSRVRNEIAKAVLAAHALEAELQVLLEKFIPSKAGDPIGSGDRAHGGKPGGPKKSGSDLSKDHSGFRCIQRFAMAGWSMTSFFSTR